MNVLTRAVIYDCSYLVLYSNGKSAVRVMPHTRQLGPHYWKGRAHPR